jgi:serine protease
MRLLIFLFAFLLFNGHSLAQNSAYVPQQFIVQLMPKVELRPLMQELSSFEGEQSRIQIVKQLVPGMEIYLLKYENTNIEQSELLEYLRQHPLILFAQNNHYVQLRSTIPNDPSFSNQWQHLNSGQSGGTLNIDMDSDLAWDLTTGGYTATGDTIVVAIIDNGCEINHPDLDANIWYNQAEIPNNNIDDDNNGYIDDYKGWNTNLNNDDVDLNGGGSQHGTEVAGLIGAEGNNNLGVAGVNWTVKLMIIRNDFNTTEANVLISYGYALQARRRYNQSNGQAGAFVVATNASWGIDYGQPASAPIWCAFYDSLGAEGILNVGATTNNSEDVDIVGDLPTTCPSDFMIGVTGHNRFGSLSGGYGDTHIDIAAATGSVTTTSNNSTYNGFGGTSAAAPQVAGAIALAYAGACADFMQLARLQPDQAALQVRQAILNGHSPTGGLVGFTAVGGRLNLDGMLQNLPCPTDSCFAVQNLQQINSTDSSLELSWQTTSDTVFYRWRMLGDTAWQGGLYTSTVNAIIPNLASCSSYEIEVFAICDSSWSAEASLIATTLGCCEQPTGLQLQAATENQASLNWLQPLGVDSFLMRWQVYNDSVWDSLSVQGSMYSLSNLQPCTYYKVQIKSLCNDTVSAFSAPIIFSTNGCPACGVSGYCDMRGTNSSADWIERFKIGGEEFVSGNDGGYVRYDSTNIQLNTELKIPFEIEQGNAFLEKVRIWMDVNRDGDFNDNNELLYDGEINFSSTLQDSLILPFIWPGRTKMRVAMRWNTSPTLCESFQNGEVEDYCVNILPPLTVLESANDLKLKLYPNPNDGSFYLEADVEGQVEIHNSLGQLIYQQQILNVGNRHRIELPSNLNQGVFYLSFRTDNQIQTLKFFKR